MAEIGSPTVPSEAELERMIRELPEQDRAELRRYHDETQAMKSDFRTEPTQRQRRSTENLRINRNALRC